MSTIEQVETLVKYQPYPEYKVSEAEWLDYIPNGWQNLPCRAIVQNIVEKNTDGKEDNYLSLMANIGVVLYEDKGDIGNKKPDDLTKCKLVRRGDLVINSMNYSIGSYGMSPYDGVCSPVYIVLRTAPSSCVDIRYALRVFENTTLQKHLSSFGNGILAHRAAISWDDIKGQYLPLPSIEEQRTIAAFLDYETARIDKLIAQQQRLLELLKEKRQAMISRTITRGLNPNAPMKDSGVELLGEVPEHWNIKPLRYLGICQNGINIGADAFGSGYPFVSYGDVYNNRVLPKTGSGLVQSTIEDRKKHSLLVGDVLFTRTSETVEEIGFASVCLNTIEDACFAGFLIRFRPNTSELCVNYSKYYFSNQLLRTFFTKEMNLITRASLSQDLLKTMPVVLPPRDEQREIATLLDEKSKRFDQLQLLGEEQIKLLKERRTALISAAVTGKIDLRGWTQTGKVAA